MIADEVKVRSYVPFLNPCVQHPEAMAYELCSQLLLVVEVSKAVGDFFQFRCPKGADIANLVEDLGRNGMV